MPVAPSEEQPVKPKRQLVTPYALDKETRKEIVKIYDNPTKGRTAFQNMAVGISKACNFAQIVLFLIMFCVLYQLTITEFTYFRGGSPCEYFNDLRLHRWLYLTLVCNVVDLYFSMNVGEAFWGVVPIFTNIVAFSINAIVMIIVVIAYIVLPANQLGTGNSGNIFQDYRFCGIAGNIADTDNLCDVFNPHGVALSPTVTMAELEWNWDGIWFFALFCAILILGFVKTVGTYFTPGSTAVAQQGVVIINQLKKANIKKLLKLQPTKDFGEKAGSYKLDFFSIFTSAQIVAYIPVMFVTWVYGFYTMTWFGWFQQDVKTWPYVYELVTSPSPHTILTHTIQFGNFIFYAFLGLNIAVFISQALMLNFRHHRWALVGSVVGFAVNVFCLAVCLFVFITTVNRDGYWWNIANDRKRFCAAQTTSPLYQWFSNPANRCKNTAACATQYSPSELELDWDFKVLLGYIAVGVFVCFIDMVYNIIIHLRIKMWRYTAEEEAEMEEAYTLRDVNLELNAKPGAIGDEIYGKVAELEEPDDAVDDAAGEGHAADESEGRKKKRKKKKKKKNKTLKKSEEKMQPVEIE